MPIDENLLAVVVGYLDMSDIARLAISNKEMFAFSQTYMQEYLTGALRVATALTRVLVFGYHNLHPYNEAHRLENNCRRRSTIMPLMKCLFAIIPVWRSWTLRQRLGLRCQTCRTPRRDVVLCFRTGGSLYLPQDVSIHSILMSKRGTL
jgi:hypothetical protein